MQNYDKYFFPVNAPISPGTPSPVQVPWEYGVRQKLQGKQLKFSRVNIRNFIVNSAVYSGTFSLNSGAGANLTTTISMNVPHQADPALSLPHIGIYLGTAQVSGSQIYPTNQYTPGSYTMWGGYDYQGFNGTNTCFTVQIGNTSGAAGTFFYILQHKYIVFNSGTTNL